MLWFFSALVIVPSVLWTSKPAQAEDLVVPEITVLGTSGKSSSLDFVPTVSELSGTRLEKKKQATIGETLARETGVTSSQFGPNASRPIIRGMDGDRIRMLQNGTGVLDASATSQDHAVAIDPLIVDRVEIVRGPAALLYGSNAVGGVVNMVTTRIPERAPEKATGKAEAKFSSTDLGRTGGLALDTALSDHWVIHVDGSARGADDYHVPGYARTDLVRTSNPMDPENKGRVYNSFNRTQSEAVGTSYVFDKGFLGTSFSNYSSNYGTVAERAVEIKMLQQRWDVGGELRSTGFIKSIRLKNSFSRYEHEEREDGATGTTFSNDGDEARVDFRHNSLLGFTGVFGTQANVFTFSAKGDEAFLPGTNNANYALFFFEERETGDFKPSFGGRFDHASVKSNDEPNFGPGQTKSFSGASFSLGALYQFTPANALVLNGAYTERAPNYQELFAKGRHVATAQHEIGDASLNKERSRSLELSWRHKHADSQGAVGVFVQDFSNFISLAPRGADDGDTDEPFEYFDYKPVAARIYGAELEYRHKLPFLLPGGLTEIELKVDMVRGTNRNTGDSLPRMTPIRETLGLLYKGNSFQADLEIQRSERQTRTAPNETKTPAYTLVNLGAELPIRGGASLVSVVARVNNIFDAEARNHVSFLKDIAPLPGRNFLLGVHATF